MPQNALASLRETMPKDNGLQPGRKVRVTPEARNALASMGRRGDTQLAHVTKQEMNLLKRLGGAGTQHPETGMREFFGAAPSGGGANAGGPGGLGGPGAAGTAGPGDAAGPAGGVGTGQGMGRAGTTPGFDPGMSSEPVDMGGMGPGSPFGGAIGNANTSRAAAAQAAAANIGAPSLSGLPDETPIAMSIPGIVDITEQDMATALGTAAIGKGMMGLAHGTAQAVGKGISAAEDALGLDGSTPSDVGTGGTAPSSGRGEGARIGSTFRAQNPDLYGGGVRVGSTRPGVEGPDLGGMNALRGLVERYG